MIDRSLAPTSATPYYLRTIRLPTQALCQQGQKTTVCVHMHSTPSSLTRCSDRSLLRSRSAPISWVVELVVAHSVPGRSSSRVRCVGFSAFHARLKHCARSSCPYVHPMHHGTCSFCQRLPAGSCRYLIALIDPAGGVFPESLVGNRMRNKVCEKRS